MSARRICSSRIEPTSCWPPHSDCALNVSASSASRRMQAEAAAEVAPIVSEARTLHRFIAPALERLWALARNLWWSWDHDSISLFRDLDPVRWRQLNNNPISL